VRTDGRTDMTKLIVAFRNFSNELKIGERAIDCLCVRNYVCFAYSSSSSVRMDDCERRIEGYRNVALSNEIGQCDFRNL
jgi:hypothetical protein